MSVLLPEPLGPRRVTNWAATTKVRRPPALPETGRAPPVHTRVASSGAWDAGGRSRGRPQWRQKRSASTFSVWQTEHVFIRRRALGGEGRGVRGRRGGG